MNTERLRELRSRSNLSNDEMKELIELAGPGEIISLPAWDTIGLIDIDRAWKNLNLIMSKADSAAAHGYFVEAISLRLQHAEFWLRMFLVAKNGKLFERDDRRTFGNIVRECENAGLDLALVEELQTFNSHRIDAIHKLLLGGIDYDELGKVCEQYDQLPGKVGAFVRDAIGLPFKPCAA